MRIHSFIPAALSAVLTFAAVSCEKSEFTPAPEGEGGFAVTFTDVDPEAPTRTFIHDSDTAQTIWWSKGDTIRFIQKAVIEEGGSAVSKAVNCVISTDRSSFSFTTKSFNTPYEGSTAEYISIFPSSRYKKSTVFSSGRIAPVIGTLSVQNPAAESFDPHADLLISQYIAVDSLQSSFTMRYRRMLAIGQMKIVNLPSASPVDTVKFSAVCGGEAVTLAGTAYYDFNVGKISTQTAKLTGLALAYPELSLTAAGETGMSAYFTSYPFNLVAGDSFRVTVITKAGETFVKDVTVPEGGKLNLRADKRTVFTVDMAPVASIAVKESSSFVKTAQKVYYTLSSQKTDITDVRICEIKADEFSSVKNLKTYVDTTGSKISASSIEKLNSGKTATFSSVNSKMWPDTDYVCCFMAVDAASDTTVVSTVIRTDWFGMRTANLTTAGSFYVYYIGQRVKSVSYHAVLTSEFEASGAKDAQSYFETNGAGTTHGVTSNLNTKGATGQEAGPYRITPSSGAGEYTFMVKATCTDGSVRYVTTNPTVKAAE